MQLNTFVLFKLLIYHYYNFIVLESCSNSNDVFMISFELHECYGDDAPAPCAGALVPAGAVDLGEASAAADRNAIELNEWFEQCIPQFSYIYLSGTKYNNYGLETGVDMQVFQVLDSPRKRITMQMGAKHRPQHLRM